MLLLRKTSGRILKGNVVSSKSRPFRQPEGHEHKGLSRLMQGERRMRVPGRLNTKSMVRI
jgi:hypothetical protein